MRERSAYVLDCPCGRILAVEGWGRPTTEER